MKCPRSACSCVWSLFQVYVYQNGGIKVFLLFGTRLRPDHQQSPKTQAATTPNQLQLASARAHVRISTRHVLGMEITLLRTGPEPGQVDEWTGDAAEAEQKGKHVRGGRRTAERTWTWSGAEKSQERFLFRQRAADPRLGLGELGGLGTSLKGPAELQVSREDRAEFFPSV